MKSRKIGKTAVKLHARIDVMSVYSSLASDRIQASAEKSLLCHLLWVRELIGAGSMSEFRWIDTRDMSADGHTVVFLAPPCMNLLALTSPALIHARR